MSGAQEYNSQLMSSLHKQGGKGSVNLSLFGKQDEALRKIFGDPMAAFKDMHADLNVKDVLGGEKGFSLGGKDGNVVFHTADPKSFESFNKQGQQGFSQASQQSSFSLAGPSTVMSTANYRMNPLIQQAGMGLGIAGPNAFQIRPQSDIQGGFLGYQGFGGIGGNAPMSMSGRMNFPSFGVSNVNFSTGGSSGGGSAAAMAGGGGGSSHSMGLPSFAGVSFGGNVSPAALGQMSARSSAPMSMSLMGGGPDISI